MWRSDRDTVEEFWTPRELRQLFDRPRDGGEADFLARLGRLLGAEGRMLAFPRAADGLSGLLRAILVPERPVVLACAFNCPVIASAIEVGGGLLGTYDLADPGGRIDWERVADSMDEHVGAIVVPHFFGVPSDFRPLIEPARRYGVAVIEDCAHTLFGRIGQSMAGTLGDAAVFSFSYDKPLSLGGGGVLLLNPSLADRFPGMAAMVAPELPLAEVEWAELLAFMEYLDARRRAFSQERRSWRWPFRHGSVNPAVYPPPTGLGPLRARLGYWMLERMEQVQRQRDLNARAIVDRAGKSWHVDQEVRPAWLKQRLTMADEDVAGRVARAIRREGMRAGNFNWPAVLQASVDPGPRPMAEKAARCGIDVPVHQRLSAGDLRRLGAILDGGF